VAEEDLALQQAGAIEVEAEPAGLLREPTGSVNKSQH